MAVQRGAGSLFRLWPAPFHGFSGRSSYSSVANSGGLSVFCVTPATGCLTIPATYPLLGKLAMPIQVVCPGCQATYQCPDETHGRSVSCRQCQRTLIVGASAEPP